MTLEEFADRELADAVKRQQQSAAAVTKDNDTRRYRHLEDQGLEDDETLVEEATERDRAWDAFKEANPRGWGNKLNKRY